MGKSFSGQFKMNQPIQVTDSVDSSTAFSSEFISLNQNGQVIPVAFTEEQVRNTSLSTLGAFTNVIISAADTVVSAFAKLQGQITALLTRIGVLEEAASFYTARLNQSLSGPIQLDRDITQYNTLFLVGALELSVAPGAVTEGCSEGVIVGDGINTPSLNGITKWITSPDYDKTSLKKNHFMVVKYNEGVFIFWTQIN